MNRQRAQGIYVVEFAIVGAVLLIVLFAVLEMGRLLYTVNVLNESVRRGARLAAVCYIHDETILRRAVFAEAGSTESRLISQLDTGQLTLRYLDEQGVEVGVPDTPDGYLQIRFVEVSLSGFEFNLLIPFIGGTIELQTFRAILPRESLGRYPEGTENTPC
ncbi:TadE family protein [Pseudomonas sp. NW5]|uniref:TadE/TadG family type IV pilus assembly protein n=1 Tax=Pseudomonas sp. NW5 TaxID=2934934 RepID=UPI00201FFBC4|nr:TadE family protein [Pseudomonas sp. NW5]MCL7461219.1 pilus assembly protein [Pseudomonas sp. NW5]